MKRLLEQHFGQDDRRDNLPLLNAATTPNDFPCSACQSPRIKVSFRVQDILFYCLVQVHMASGGSVGEELCADALRLWLGGEQLHSKQAVGP